VIARRTSAAGAPISERDLNRATLARQHLLERSTLSPLAMTEHLVGWQAQTAQSWYVGFWCRIEGVRPQTVSELLERRELVRIALMRSTIHLVTAQDALALRPLLQPILDRTVQGTFGKHLTGLDRRAVGTAGRQLLEQRPMLFSELGRALAQLWPDRDPASLAQSVRATEALVQVTPRGLWGHSGAAAHTTVQAWLGRELDDGGSLDDLVLRYLAAFGPASVKDVQQWSGLTRLAEVVARLRPELVTFVGQNGRELLDLPDAPRPSADVEAPVRYLYDYDNLLLSHADRSRFFMQRYGRQVYPDNVQPRIILIDGATDASWLVERSKATADAAVVTVRPFRRLTKSERAAVIAEGVELARWLEPAARTHDVRIGPPT
jgi:hypothetical protein